MRAKYVAPLLAAAAFLTATAANAATGYTMNKFNVYSGPGRDYPKVDRIPRNAAINVHGCIRAYDWCDVTYHGVRGWVDGGGITMPYEGRRVSLHEFGERLSVPMVEFRVGSYWDAHYRARPFYGQRAKWAVRDEDHDHIPNVIDRDRDGDGVPNAVDHHPDNPRRD